MTSMAVRVNEKIDIIQSESQSLALMKHLLSTSFSCIGYLRDLFEEKNFSDHYLCELALKRLTRGVSVEADTFLDWIELGIYDALDKKYLRCIYLGIFVDPNNPNDVIEWYTFKVSYAPFDQASASDISSLSIEQNNNEILHFSQKEGDFKRSSVQILRTMCILTQTLKSLPSVKYLTIRVYYYEDRTPANYQPPLFSDCQDGFSLKTSNNDILRFDLGQAATPFHTMSLKIQTKSDLLPNNDHGSQNLKETIIDNPRPHSVNADVLPAKNSYPIFQTDDKIENDLMICSPIDLLENDNELPITIMDTQPPIIPAHVDPQQAPSSSFKQVSEPICCPCGVLNSDSESDLAMIFCDSCRTWQHTVCCGYFSNSDKRIPNDTISTHTCYNCLFKAKPKVLKFCSDLSLFRVALFVIFNDAIVDNSTLTKQLGITFRKAAFVLKKLAAEGFLLKKSQDGFPTRYFYECIKSNDVKKKIKYYFTLNLDNFPEYHRAMGKILASKSEKMHKNNATLATSTNGKENSPIIESSKSCHNTALHTTHNPFILDQNNSPPSKKRKQASSIDCPLRCCINN